MSVVKADKMVRFKLCCSGYMKCDKRSDLLFKLVLCIGHTR